MQVVGRRAIWGAIACVSLIGQAWAADRGSAAAAREAAALMHSVVGNDSSQRRAFLLAMPKGADLHKHLGGSNYAEDFLRGADEDRGCIARDTQQLLPPPCGDDAIPARGLAARDAAFFPATVDALSMRNVVRGNAAASGHDPFFSSFARFGSSQARLQWPLARDFVAFKPRCAGCAGSPRPGRARSARPAP
ncbi:hypothetical protein [Xanthomonas translucens]|nr:hypothetical protein [Xanthomonas translucens]MCS3359171.1 hypothetical protein [Xanthomonas translucens pv. translucens]MCS3372160.1 hypothetical protein [Xanthomonas translucens pv. translucens]MCT8276902.1 hypothetical protein [Xanthomonas translucens pv. translucens]MCT8288634.1 hypothetical protein [Xanthomonas translucens pv. translucens]MCT8292429.1 hypothetical protein [Xanthomonas translucens pv. translucens]